MLSTVRWQTDVSFPDTSPFPLTSVDEPHRYVELGEVELATVLPIRESPVRGAEGTSVLSGERNAYARTHQRHRPVNEAGGDRGVVCDDMRQGQRLTRSSSGRPSRARSP